MLVLQSPRHSSTLTHPFPRLSSQFSSMNRRNIYIRKYIYANRAEEENSWKRSERALSVSKNENEIAFGLKTGHCPYENVVESRVVLINWGFFDFEIKWRRLSDVNKDRQGLRPPESEIWVSKKNRTIDGRL